MRTFSLNHFKLGILFMLQLLLISCMTQPQPAKTVIHEERVATETPEDQEQQRIKQEEVSELLAKKELVLTDLFRLAELNNPSIAAARRDVEAAEGRVKQAGLWANPSLEIESEGIPADDFGFNESENSIGISYPWVIGGRRKAAVSEERARLEAQRYQSFQKIRESKAELYALYTKLIYLRQAIALHGELAAVAEETYKTAKTRVDAGAALKTTMVKARIDLLELKLAEKRLKSEAAVARKELSYLLGGVDLRNKKLKGELQPYRKLELDDLKTFVRQWHPQVLAAGKEREAAAFRLKKAQAQRYADLNTRLAYSRDEAVQENFIEMGVSIPLPLFDRQQGKIAESEALLEKSKKDEERISNTLLTELTKALANCQTAHEEYEALQKEILPITELALTQTRASYQGGKVSFLDVLDAQRSYTRGKISLLNAAHQMNQSQVAIWKIAGEKINQDLKDDNKQSDEK